ncbi:type II secretion system protein [Colwellia sp. UCD-KL20]|uniref:prepilin-type N-terminal cleavage/methylation domain-containing protein n=1 Tax=Colwellia sp. UCD-KL20 TaxID=1917165 RepID=UPI00097024CF|nr:type II secretion system protein [Colwellia sp. UCD-KL20]
MRKQSGFTLIELVIVVVILGFLAVTAIPKFINLTDQAKQANIEGMAGGFATGISLARAQWEAEARPTDSNNRNIVDYDGTDVLLTTENKPAGIRGGYIVASVPTGGVNNGETLTSGFSDNNCVDIWNSILQQPPGLTNDISVLNNSNGLDYYTTNSGSGADTLCHYFLKETLNKNAAGDFVAPTGTLTDVGNSFTYRPATSQIIVYINI